ncbi:MAG: hypothetical protein ABFS43_05875 [Thermodesulfobacteriota bacterium]
MTTDINHFATSGNPNILNRFARLTQPSSSRQSNSGRSCSMEVCLILIRSLTPQQAAENALAVAVQVKAPFIPLVVCRFNISIGLDLFFNLTH